MVRSFVKAIVVNYPNYLALPPCYKQLFEEYNFPVGNVILRDNDGNKWNVIIEEIDDKSYNISVGWVKVAVDLDIQEEDFIVFELLETSVLKMSVFKSQQHKFLSSTFIYWFVTPAIQKMMLPRAYMNHYFKNRVVEQPIIIRFGARKEWNVRLQKVSKEFFFTDGWNNIFNDLSLRLGHFLVFEKVGKYSFQLFVFRADSMEVEPEPVVGGDNEESPVSGDDLVEISSGTFAQSFGAYISDEEDVDINVDESVKEDVTEEAVDAELVTKVTDRFRFPKGFAEKAVLEDGIDLKMRFENGVIKNGSVRMEVDGRFALRNWNFYFSSDKNEVVDSINEELLKSMLGEEKFYFSSDSLCESEEESDINMALFSPDVLNSLHFSGLPNHKLVLKVGAPVMLLRNIDQANGLCNGTRLQVTKLGKVVIEAKIIARTNIGHHTLISRLKMTPSDKRIPVKIARRQFPVSLCFAMTINKSQGQSFERVGLYLPRPVFSHGQLYVALSRVKRQKGLKILICDKEKQVRTTATNMVYKEVLQNL